MHRALITLTCATAIAGATLLVLRREIVHQSNKLSPKKVHWTAADLTPADDDLFAFLPDYPDTSYYNVEIPTSEGDQIRLGSEQTVSRYTAARVAKWTVTLAGTLRRSGEPNLAADSERVYVAHDDGITALDARDGSRLWHSVGPADCMLLSGDLLLATECTSRDLTDEGRYLLARNTATGQPAFRVELPAVCAPRTIEELAGLFLVQSHHWSVNPSFDLLVDRAGQIHHRFAHEVLDIEATAEGRVVLAGHGVVRLSSSGSIDWKIPLSEFSFFNDGQLQVLPDGTMIAFQFGQISNSGVQVTRFNPQQGTQIWQASCKPLDVSHSKYHHVANVHVVRDRLRVSSRGSFGSFVEDLDITTGLMLRRKERR